jgi:hypothetical protein
MQERPNEPDQQPTQFIHPAQAYLQNKLPRRRSRRARNKKMLIITGLVLGVFILIGAIGSALGKGKTPATPADAVARSTAASPATSQAAPTMSPSPPPAAAAPVASKPVAYTSSAAPTSAPAARVYIPPAPRRTTQAPQPVHTTAQAHSCYPLTNGGNCYRPGEYCRASDHGASGIDANGDAIKCEDSDGWRWERV